MYSFYLHIPEKDSDAHIFPLGHIHPETFVLYIFVGLYSNTCCRSFPEKLTLCKLTELNYTSLKLFNLISELVNLVLLKTLLVKLQFLINEFSIVDKSNFPAILESRSFAFRILELLISQYENSLSVMISNALILELLAFNLLTLHLENLILLILFNVSKLNNVDIHSKNVMSKKSELEKF